VLLDQGEQIPDSVKSARRDSLYAGAERLARRAVAADSMGADGHFALAAAVGRASLGMGKKERIRRARVIRDEALRTLALNPRHDGAYHILGRWNAEIMRLSGLSRFFAKSLLGAGVFKQASWEGAVSNMERAVELDPGRLYHRLELAQIYVDRKRYDDARAQLEALQRLPDREIMDSVYRRQAEALAARIARKH
jgi:tetratricopeptide (TPR) repeat protein